MALAKGDQAIQLVPMHRLAEAKDYWEDDWTGLRDVGARKKRQARLSKRAQRRRKIAERQYGPSGNHIFMPLEESKLRFQQMSSPSQGNVSGLANGTLPTLSRATSLALYKAIVTNKLNSTCLQPYIHFPLPADHLLTLIQFNVYRAIITNMEILTPISYQSAISNAHQQTPLPPIPTAASSRLVGVPLSPILAEMPPSLFPTPLQRQIPHPSWIDTIPLAALRDNLISEMGKYDEVTLCLDTLGCLFHDYHDDDYEDRKGIMVWSDPWNISAWELSEGFVHKWGFLLKGCEELLDATNCWRGVRGESSLVLGV